MLKLADELRLATSSDAQALEWRSLSRWSTRWSQRYLEFLPKQTYPIRTGVHPNTAFGLAFALDYATPSETPSSELVIARSTRLLRQRHRLSG